MDVIFMNSVNGKTSYWHRLFFSLTCKINLQRVKKSVALSNLSVFYKWKNIENSYEDIWRH